MKKTSVDVMTLGWMLGLFSGVGRSPFITNSGAFWNSSERHSGRRMCALSDEDAIKNYHVLELPCQVSC